MRLSKFLNKGEYAGACSALSTGWPGIALPPGSAHYIPKKIKNEGSCIAVEFQYAITFEWLKILRCGLLH